MAKTNNTAEIGFEKEIWKAADLLRGNLDASEYKSVVLGLIFLKYISDRFEVKYNELVDEGDGFEEDKDEYTAENIFFVPQEARWQVVAEAAHTPEVGTTIDNAMRLIEKENPRLKGILPKNFARPELDKRRLGDVVDLFTNIQMKEHGDTKLRILPLQVCRSRRQAGRRILHACLHCAHAGRGASALQRPCVRPLLRVGRHVCAVGPIHRRTSGQPQRYLRLRAGQQPYDVENGADEPGHPWHRGRLG